MKELEKQLKALANVRRLKILKYLERVNRASVSDIAKEINLSFKSTSRHLAILRTAEIVINNQEALVVFYRLITPQSKIVKESLTMC